MKVTMTWGRITPRGAEVLSRKTIMDTGARLSRGLGELPPDHIGDLDKLVPNPQPGKDM